MRLRREGIKRKRISPQDLVEAKKDKSIFSIEEEIQPEDWEQILEELELFRVEKKWEGFIEMASSVKFLSPSKLSKIPLEDGWEGLRAKLKQVPKGDKTELKARLTADLKHLFPERIDSLGLTKEESEEMRKTHHAYEVTSSTTNACALAVFMKLLYPVEANQLDFTKLKHEALEYLQEVREKKFTMSYFLADMVLLFPESFSEFSIDEDTWTKLVGELKKDRAKGKWLDFVKKAKCLKFISERASITQSGFINIDSNLHLPPPTPLPERVIAG